MSKIKLINIYNLNRGSKKDAQFQFKGKRINAIKAIEKSISKYKNKYKWNFITAVFYYK